MDVDELISLAGLILAPVVLVGAVLLGLGVISI